MTWATYMVRCSDGTLYAGATNDLERRVRQHSEGTGAKYTRGRGPVVLVWWVPAEDQSEACRTEALVKGLSRHEKENLINMNSSERKDAPPRSRTRP